MADCSARWSDCAEFRTGSGKSRLTFLSRLLGGTASYVINAAAIAYMRAGNLAQDVIDGLGGHASRVFRSHEDGWTTCVPSAWPT